MKCLLAGLVLILCGPNVNAQPPATTTGTEGAGLETLSHGLYCRTPGGWKKMQPVMQSGFSTKHGASGLVGVPPGGVYLYTGPAAEQQFENRRPEFGIVTDPSRPNIPGGGVHDLVIVRMSQKEDHREVGFLHGGFASARTGISSKDIVDAELTPVSDHAYTLIPKKDLTPGEYLITFRRVYGIEGYDFGVKH